MAKTVVLQQRPIHTYQVCFLFWSADLSSFVQPLNINHVGQDDVLQILQKAQKPGCTTCFRKPLHLLPLLAKLWKFWKFRLSQNGLISCHGRRTRQLVTMDELLNNSLLHRCTKSTLFNFETKEWAYRCWVTRIVWNMFSELSLSAVFRNPAAQQISLAALLCLIS